MSKSKLRKEYEARFGVVDVHFMLYDAKGAPIYLEDSNGYWIRREYGAKGNEIRFESFKGYWIRREYDANGNEIYVEDSISGVTIDNRSYSERVFIDEQTGKKFKLTEVK
tara:strand:- start:223 stop:552 length:330 start_codon:yes stop_codon:yes gene_type:complete